jgi:hypothetical protein
MGPSVSRFYLAQCFQVSSMLQHVISASFPFMADQNIAFYICAHMHFVYPFMMNIDNICVVFPFAIMNSAANLFECLFIILLDTCRIAGS